MSVDLHSSIDFSTHAYLIRGGVGVTEHVLSLLEKKGVIVKGNPDCLMQTFEVFSVDDARALASFAALKPIGKFKYLLVQAQSMTSEAQSALLKVVEEGSGHSMFFFVIPTGVPVLSTLLSRCVVVRDGHADAGEQSLGEKFLSLSYKERLLRAETFGKDSDREGARLLVRSLLRIASSKTFDTKKLRDLLEADQYLQLSGSSPKGVIGHLALVL